MNRLLPSLFALLLGGCVGSGVFGEPTHDDDTADDDDTPVSPFDEGVVELLDDTFRIDIERIDVGLDWTPGAETYLGEATVRFRMRPGQTVPVIHFTPPGDVGGDTIATLVLDDEPLDVGDSGDVLATTLPGSPQRVLELQRVLDDSEHVLEVTWEAPAWWDDVAPGWLFTDVSDIAGEGNEILFPTINSPDELARHVIELRVHAETPYRVLGSGLVEEVPGDEVQTWRLDTEREVASITVLLVAAPRSAVSWDERTVAGVDVRIASITEAWEVEQAFDDAEAVLEMLEADFGPLPMEQGLSILLMTDYGGGMEYFGGTITDGWALQHELVHMYFGTSTVARTWRDSWWDEAINVWYLWPDGFDPLPGWWGSDMVSGRTPVQPSFDLRAYNEGAGVFDLVAERVGGRAALVEALAAIRDEHTFSPFTTGDLVLYLEAETGVDLTDEFAQWVYGE